MSDYLFEKEINIIGLRRSGKHALYMWLLPYLKNAIVQSNTRFNFILGRRFRTFFSHHQKEIDVVFTDDTRIEKEDFIGNYVCTVEDCYPSEIGRMLNDPEYEYNVRKIYLAEKYHRKFFSKQIFNIIVLRTPHNNLASALAKGGAGGKNAKTGAMFRDLWIQYAKEVVGSNNYIPNKVIFLFDKWFTDESYRRSLASLLGFTFFTDSGLNQISNLGSSFDDKEEFQYNAQKLDVLNRWKYYIDHPSFCDAVENKLVMNLAVKIFGDQMEWIK